MVERFTGRARRVMVLAQEEARMLHHDYIAAERIPRETRPGVRTVVVAGTPLRVAIRPGTGPLRGYLYQHAAGLGWTSLPFLPLIRQPTLVLAGDDDPIIPLANARILAALIPGARLHIYHGGHLELVARPGLLAPVVAGFLAGARPAMVTTSSNEY